jgi:DNA (cytosine-5)-methyltransferase 1
MKYIELFAGVGGFRSALDALGMECVFSSEIDKYAVASYKALYGGEELHGDITKIDAADIPDHDLLVGGFPCQAFSLAGHRKGFEDTRGTLFFEIIRIASAKNPKWLMLENVKGLLSHDGGKTFDVMCACLNDIGYALDFKVLNSKHYGVPQNRERIFIIANRDAAHEDWTVQGNDVVAKAKKRIAKLGIKTFNFDFPSNNTVDKRLRDVLQDNVPEKYYLSQEKTMKLITQLREKDSVRVTDDGFHEYRNDDKKSSIQGTHVTFEEGNAHCLTSQHKPQVLEPKINVIGTTLNTGAQGTNSRHWVHDVNGLIGTVDATTYKQPKQILEPQVNVIGHADIKGMDVIKRVYGTEGLSPTITTMGGGHREPKIAEVYRIRKLTPLECWRLQGFTDEQFQKCVDAGVSDSQLYKQAGNAVTVNVISELGKTLALYDI